MEYKSRRMLKEELLGTKEMPCRTGKQVLFAINCGKKEIVADGAIKISKKVWKHIINDKIKFILSENGGNEDGRKSTGNN